MERAVSEIGGILSSAQRTEAAAIECARSAVAMASTGTTARSQATAQAAGLRLTTPRSSIPAPPC